MTGDRLTPVPLRPLRAGSPRTRNGLFLLWSGALLLLVAVGVVAMDPPPPAPLAWLVFLPLSLAIIRAGLLEIRSQRR